MSYHDVRRMEFLQRTPDLAPARLLASVSPYDVGIEPAEIAVGNSYWRVAGVHHLSPDENRGGHAAYVDVVDEAGRRVDESGLRVVWGWQGQHDDEHADPKKLDKPPEEPATNVDLYPDQRTWVRVEGGGLPSDRVFNLHSKHGDEPWPTGDKWNTVGHHSFYVLFQRTRKAASSIDTDTTEEPEAPVTEPVLEIADFGPISHQDLINAAAKAAASLGLSDSWLLLTKCGLSVEELAADRRARYQGVPLHELPNLSVVERNALTRQMTHVLAMMPVPPRPDAAAPPAVGHGPDVTSPTPQPPPVTSPVPASVAANRLGFYLHLSTDQNGLWESIRRVQPPVILIHADTANRMLLREIRSFRAPDAFVIGRMYKDGNTQGSMLRNPDPAAAGRGLAEEILGHDMQMATERGSNGRLLIDAWMSLNEAVPGPASRQFAEHPEETAALLRAYDAFQAAFCERLRRDGVEAVAFNFGAGNFTIPEHYLDYFPQTLGSFVYLGFHEYGWPALWPGQDTATSAMLYRTCMEGIRVRFGNRHRVVITEAGLARMYRDSSAGDVGWLNADAPLSQEEYWRSLEWYNSQLAQDDYVLGACLYEVGHHGDWVSFRHLGQDSDGQPLRLMAHIEALNTGASSPQAVPFQVPDLPQPLEIAGKVTASGVAVAGATVRLVGGQETLGTVRHASALAATSLAWTRMVTGYEGSIAQARRKFMADGSVPLTLPQFRERMLQYNPSLRTTNGLLEAAGRYRIPEVKEASGEIAWDRPLTGFSGSAYACWLQYVARKVVGMTYGDFKRDVVHYNPRLSESDLRFEPDQRYNLPRTAGQTEYVLVAVTNSRGVFRFHDLPAGRYRIEVEAEGYLTQALSLDVRSDWYSEIDLAAVTSGLQPAWPYSFSPGAVGDFVRAHDSEFVADGRVLRFVGVNIRGLVHYGDGQTLRYTTLEHRREQIRAARDIGARVIRVFLPCHNVSPQETANRLQGVLDIIREEAPGMYLLPALSNLYNDVPFRVPGDDGFYERIDPNFGGDLLNAAFFHGGYRDHFLPFVRHIVQAFRQEPHIFAWEVGNELKLNPMTNDLASDPNVNAFVNFMHAIAQEIRQIDDNHMVTTGMISTHHASLHTEELKRRLYGARLFDFLTVHCYNDELINDDSELASQLKKPYIVEEAGFDADRGADRSGRMEEDMTRWFNRGARGYMPWGFMATVDDIGDGDNRSGLDRALHGDWNALTNLLRQRADRLTRDAPAVPTVTPPPTPVQPSPSTPPAPERFQTGQTVYSCDWINVRKSAGYLNKLGDDIIGMLAPYSAVSVTGGPVSQDELAWYSIHGSLSDGRSVDGWVAASTNTLILLSSKPPQTPPPIAFGATASDTARAASQILYAVGYVNLRHVPGYVGKASDDVIGQIPRGARVDVLGGPAAADGLAWWPLRAPLLDNSIATGWAAEIDPSGIRLLDSREPDQPSPFDSQVHGTPLLPGDDLVILNSSPLRPEASLSDEPHLATLATVASNAHVTAIDGPEFGDALEWWRLKSEAGPASSHTGWVEVVTSSGTRMLVTNSVAEQIHVSHPLQAAWPVTQSWGANPQTYVQFTYDGVALKGHNGLDFGVPAGIPLLAVDSARVLRVGYEPDGFGHFVVLGHAWGESLYAHMSRVDVAYGEQLVVEQVIGLSGDSGVSTGPHLHFGIRIFPYRRADGWGGFVNPVPFLSPDRLVFSFSPTTCPSLMAPELPGRLRP